MTREMIIATGLDSISVESVNAFIDSIQLNP
jgi:hypothetical protein